MVKDRKTKLILAAVICASTVMALVPNAMAADVYDGSQSGNNIHITAEGNQLTVNGANVNLEGNLTVNGSIVTPDNRPLYVNNLGIWKDGGISAGNGNFVLSSDGSLHIGDKDVLATHKGNFNVDAKTGNVTTVGNVASKDIIMNVSGENRSFTDTGIVPGINEGQKSNVAIGATAKIIKDNDKPDWAKPGSSVAIGSDAIIKYTQDFTYNGGQGENASNNIAIGNMINNVDSPNAILVGSYKNTKNSAWSLNIGSGDGPGNGVVDSRNAIAVGHNTTVQNSAQGISIGSRTQVYDSENAIAIGGVIGADIPNNNNNNTVIAQSNNATAIGAHINVTNATNSITMGTNAQTTGDNAINFGSGSVVNVKNGIAIGSTATVNRGDNGIVIGSGAIVNGGPDSIVLGTDAATGKKHALALGAGSQVNADDSVALGYNSVVNRDEVNVVSVGKSGQDGFTRRIINVSEGRLAEDSNDAVTGKQLYATNQNIGDLKYTSHNYIQDNDNLTTAASKLDEQVKENADNTASNKNEIDALHNSGIVAGNIADGIKNAVVVGNSEVFGNGDGSVVVGNGGFVAGEDSVGLGNNVVIGNNANNSVALGSGSVVYDKNTVSVGSDEIKRTISNVADGVNANDAVNKSQLDAVSTVAGQHTTLTEKDENIVVTKTEKDGQLNYDVALNKNIKVDSVTAGNVQTNTLNSKYQLTVGDTNADGTKPFYVNSSGSFYAANAKFQVDKDANLVSEGTAQFGDVKIDNGIFYKNTALRDGYLTLTGEGGTTQLTDNYLMVGSKTYISANGFNANRQKITNVADGVIASDAVNKGQLDAVANKVDNVNAGAVKYDTNTDGTINKDKVTLDGKDGTTISNVKDGVDKNDAVNKGQLDSVQTNLQGQIDSVNNTIGDIGNLNNDINPDNTIVGSLNAVDNKIGDLNELNTMDNTSVVGAINEVNSQIGQVSGDVSAVTGRVDKLEDNTTGITYDKTTDSTVIGSKDNPQNLTVNGDVTANNVKADNVTTNTVNATDGTFHNSVVVGGTQGTQITGSDVVINKGTDSEVSLSGVNTHINDVDAKVGDTAKLNDEITNNDSYKNDQSLVGAVNAESAIRGQQVSDLNSRVTSLGSRVDNLESRMGDVEDRIDKVGAMSAAIANLRTMGYDPQAPTEIAVGVGQYKSETGLALGIFHYPNQDFMLSLSVSTSGDEVMGGVGATWKLGRKTPAQIEENREAKKIKEAEALKKAAKEAEVKAQAERHAKLLAEREAKHEA